MSITKRKIYLRLVLGLMVIFFLGKYIHEKVVFNNEPKKLLSVLSLTTLTNLRWRSTSHQRSALANENDNNVTVVMAQSIYIEQLQRDYLVVDSNKMALTSTDMTYSQMLHIWADSKNTIILVYIDFAYLEMGLNFMEVSLLPYGITNILYVSSTLPTCYIVRYVGIPCYVFNSQFVNKRPNLASNYRSPDFISKSKIRIEMIDAAIQLGYNVLHSDSDIVYVKNPLQYIYSECKQSCDIASLWDSGPPNSGFMYVKPTAGSKWLYNAMIPYAKTHAKVDDQGTLRDIIKTKEAKAKVSLLFLSKKKFLSGLVYFQQGTKNNSLIRHFYRTDSKLQCLECVVIHDNWIVGRSAKIYRMREHLMWMYDGKKYFSDPSRKYLTYSNTHTANKEGDTLSLKNALTIGYILNRTVILPKFHCDKKSVHPNCSLLSVFKVSELDKYFSNKYREHMFLHHPKVPQSIQFSAQEQVWIYFIANTYTKLKEDMKPNNLKILRPAQLEIGVHMNDILHWFSNNTDPVINFHSLYFPEIRDVEKSFSSKVTKSLISASYLQK